MSKVFFQPGNKVVDNVVVFDGVSFGQYSGQTFEQLAAEYPGLEIGDSATVWAAYYKGLIFPPTRITQQRFFDMLEVLPPEGWHREGGSESFKMSEYEAGNITTIFVRIGTEYYELQDQATLTHLQIVQKVTASLAAKIVTKLEEQALS
jgi:hypothetical protein